MIKWELTNPKNIVRNLVSILLDLMKSKEYLDDKSFSDYKDILEETNESKKAIPGDIQSKLIKGAENYND